MAPDFVVGPINPCGLLMKPSAREVLDELGRTRIPVIAKELRAGGVNSLAQGALFARGHVHGLAVDLADMDDTGAPSSAR